MIMTSTRNEPCEIDNFRIQISSKMYKFPQSESMVIPGPGEYHDDIVPILSIEDVHLEWLPDIVVTTVRIEK